MKIYFTIEEKINHLVGLVSNFFKKKILIFTPEKVVKFITYCSSITKNLKTWIYQKIQDLKYSITHMLSVEDIKKSVFTVIERIKNFIFSLKNYSPQIILKKIWEVIYDYKISLSLTFLLCFVTYFGTKVINTNLTIIKNYFEKPQQSLTQAKKVENESRNIASIAQSDKMKKIKLTKNRLITLYHINIPIIDLQKKYDNTLYFDLNIVMSSFSSYEFINNRQAEINGEINRKFNLIDKKFSLTEEGKEVIKEKIKNTIDSFLIKEKVRGSVENIYINNIDYK